MPRILWICRNANMRRACWGQTSCQDRPARTRWPASHSLCELRHSHTLPAVAKLKAPLGMRNCAGSCSHPLVPRTLPGSPGTSAPPHLLRGPWILLLPVGL